MSTRVASLPERPRSYRFALTPLADAMFQLLIFFMLTSSLTPYSLVTLRGAPADEAAVEQTEEEYVDENATTPAAAPTAEAKVTIWALGNGIVVVNDAQTYDISQLPDLAKAIGTQDNPGKIVISVGELARVQDIAAAIEALDSAEVSAVQISRTRP